MSDQIKQTIQNVLEELAGGLETGSLGPRIRIGLTIDGSELGHDVMKEAVAKVRQSNLFDVVLIGSDVDWDDGFEHVATTDCQKDAYEIMEEMLAEGTLDGCVTLHYNFPIGVSTVGRVVTPAFGREMLIATTTGTTDANRNIAMVLNTVNGIIAAKATGIKEPTVGILNVEGARTVERALHTLNDSGYPIRFGQSCRADGGAVLRGNDLLMGSVDVAVCDSLTGNILMKLFSASASGGNYEVTGSGYGPGIGLDYDKNICIISRESGAPVIASALAYAYQLAKGRLGEISQDEYKKAQQANLKAICASLKPAPAETAEEVKAPEKEIVTAGIAGIDVMELEEAVKVLWKNGVYAESGMGCTGPIVLVSEKKEAQAETLLKEARYLG